MVKSGGGGLGFKVSRSEGRDESLEATPQASAVERLTDKDIAQEFEKMLENMNLSEEKKEPLRRNLISKKKEMLIMHLKNNARVNYIMPTLVYTLTPGFNLDWIGVSRSLHPDPGGGGQPGATQSVADQPQPGVHPGVRCDRIAETPGCDPGLSNLVMIMFSVFESFNLL